MCRDRGETPPKKAAYLESDSPDCEDEAAGEMCQELLEIFQGSPRCAPPGPVDCGMVDLATVQPPSRNQNPLVKDQVCLFPDLLDRMLSSRSGRPDR